MQTHDVILFYGFNHIFNIQREEYVTRGGTYNYHLKKYGKEAAEERHMLGKEVQDVWMIKSNTSKNYPTQKPYKLLERIICLSTK
jgi:DNA modification methylase